MELICQFEDEVAEFNGFGFREQVLTYAMRAQLLHAQRVAHHREFEWANSGFTHNAGFGGCIVVGFHDQERQRICSSTYANRCEMVSSHGLP